MSNPGTLYLMGQDGEWHAIGGALCVSFEVKPPVQQALSFRGNGARVTVSEAGWSWTRAKTDEGYVSRFYPDCEGRFRPLEMQ